MRRTWLAGVLLSVCATAHAGAITYEFALAPQPLPHALSAFSRITGHAVVYTQDAPYSLQAPALSGAYTAEQALAHLLGTSGLAFRRVTEHTFTLQPARAADSGLWLATTSVEARGDQEPTYRTPAQASVARGDTSLRDIPHAINVVPAQALRDQQPRNLDDALANVSGVVQGNTLGSTQDTLMKRGFGENRDGAIMRDGMPMVQGRNLNATAERIEVLKGPSSLLYGIQDPGGIINVVSKRPQWQAVNSLSARVSTFGSGKNGSGGTLDSTGPLGDSGLAYRLILDQEDEDYWRNFGVHRETLVAPSLAWANDRTQLLAAWEHREFRYPFDRGTAIDPSTNRPLHIPSTRRLDEPFNDMRGRSDWYRLEADHTLSDTWSGHAGLSYDRETYDASQVRVTAVDPDRGTLTRSMDGTADALSVDRFITLSLSGTVELLGLRHDLLLGADDEYRKIYRGELIRQRSLATFSYLDPRYGQEVEGATVSAPDSNQLDRLRSHALFAQDTLHLNDRWSLVGGARFQRYDQRAGKGRPFTVNTDLDGQRWVPRAGVVYKASDTLSLYASYTESFKPSASIAPLSGGAVIDSGTAPERARSWELGAKWETEDGVTATLALFDIRKLNVLVANFDAVSATTLYSTAGQVRSRGLEADVSGELSERWSLIGAYAYTDAWVADDPALQGNRLQNVPRHNASLFAVYDTGEHDQADRWRLGGGARVVGRRAGNPDNDFELPGYTVFDAFASYQTTLGGQRVRLQMNLKNLFDRTYYSSAVSRYFVSLGDARQLTLSSTLEF